MQYFGLADPELHQTHLLLIICRVGQKVCSSFSVPWSKNLERTFWPTQLKYVRLTRMICNASSQFIPPTPIMQPSSWYFHHILVSPILEIHRSMTTQCIPFCVWILFICMTLVRFCYVITSMTSSFLLFPCSFQLCGYFTPVKYIHPPVVSFPVFVVINGTAANN